VRERRTSAGARLRRLLAMIPWLAANDGPPVEEVCARFAITKAELQRDLELLTSYVGVPPYGPDRLFHVTIEGGRVFAHLTPALDRPLRLTPDEAVALVVAGQALPDVPGAEEGALGRALAKLAGLLGVDPAEAVEVDLGTGSAPTLGALRQAVEGRRRVEIEHLSLASGERRTRVVDPWQVVHQDGTWYLIGHDHLRGQPRTFRVDRILSATVLDEPAAPAPADAARGAFSPADTDPRVTLDLAADAGWVVETYPVESVEPLDGGSLRVRLVVATPSFLESLLLRLGPAASVVDAPPGLAGAASGAARRVLARYPRPSRGRP
jgi:proteasome accessory factor C